METIFFRHFQMIDVVHGTFGINVFSYLNFRLWFPRNTGHAPNSTSTTKQIAPPTMVEQWSRYPRINA